MNFICNLRYSVMIRYMNKTGILLSLAVLIQLVGSSEIFGQADSVLLDEGIKAYEQKNYEGAAKILTDYLAIYPASAKALFYRGNAYFGMKKNEEAIADYEKALKNGFSNAEIHYNLGKAYLQTGNFSSAIVELNKSLSINPQNVPAYIELGCIFTIVGDPTNAKEILNKALVY